MNTITSLCVVSHVTHCRHRGRLYAYGPYAREIDVWADLVPEVRIAAPCREEPPPGDAVAFTRANISILPQPETGGVTLGAKLRQVLALPRMIWSLARAMRHADAVHVRCPGNLGLLGVALAPLCSRSMVAKYAGQWSRYPGEPRSYALQRALLRSGWWRGPVTVYGRWPDQPAHVVPFFSAALDAGQMRRARSAAIQRSSDGTLRVLYVGRLSAGKNVGALLEAIARMRAAGFACTCTVVGDGPERAALEAQAQPIAPAVTFVGGVQFEQVLAWYERSDVLVLASESEGWPKALAEAMAFGLICIGSDRGLIPEMLAEGRGIIVPPGDAAALAVALGRIAAQPEAYAAMRARATAWAQHYSLEGLREALRELLAEHWGRSISERPVAPW